MPGIFSRQDWFPFCLLIVFQTHETSARHHPSARLGFAGRRVVAHDCRSFPRRSMARHLRRPTAPAVKWGSVLVWSRTRIPRRSRFPSCRHAQSAARIRFSITELPPIQLPPLCGQILGNPFFQRGKNQKSVIRQCLFTSGTAPNCGENRRLPPLVCLGIGTVNQGRPKSASGFISHPASVPGCDALSQIAARI